MTDTITGPESASEREPNDAEGYFVEGDALFDKKAPTGPIAERWDSRKFNARLVNPANRRKLSVIVVGTGLAGALGRRHARRAGLQREVLLLPGLARAAPTRSPPRAGSTPPRTTRTTATSVYRLFYDTVKGGDFRSREANVYRLAEVSRQHHRPVRRPGRAVRPRVRRPARQPLLRRRPGLAHLLRPRPDRPAAAARRLPGARAPDRRRHRRDVHPPRDARPRRRRRPGPRHHHPRPGHRRDRDATPPTPWCWPPAATATSSTSPPTPRAATSPPTWRAHRKGAYFANPCYTQIHPTCIPVSGDYQSKLTLMSRVAAQRRPHLGAEEPGDDATRTRARSPRPSATTTSSACTRLRQPGAPRHRLARRQGGLRRGPRRRPAAALRRLPRLRRRHRAPRARTRSREKYGNLFDMYAAHHRRGPVRGADAHLPGRPLHDGRPVGRLRPAVHDPRPVRGRRGQLLRPRRQPPRRLGADAGPGRRLLRAARTPSATTSPTARSSRSTDDHAGLRRGREPRSRAGSTSCSSINGDAHASTRSTASSARSCGSTAAWPAPRRACSKAHRPDPRAARGVLAQRQGARHRRRRSTSRSRRPAAWPTSSSSAS